MPKQVIRPGNPDNDAFQIVVGWNKGMDVQIGIETPDRSDGQRHLVDHIYGDDQTLVEIGRNIVQRLNGYNGHEFGGDRPTIDLSKLQTSDAERVFYQNMGRDVLDAVTGSTPFGTGVYTHPDRRQMNDLIRAARTARDSAFGKDQ